MSTGMPSGDAYYDVPDNTEWSDRDADAIDAAVTVLLASVVHTAIDQLGEMWEEVPDLSEDMFREADERVTAILTGLIGVSGK